MAAILLLISISAQAFTDCTEKDQCKSEACETKMTERIDAGVVLACKKIYKIDQKKGRHVFAYYEVDMYVQGQKEGKLLSESAMTLRLK